MQCKDPDGRIHSIHFEEGDAAIFNGGTTIHQVPPNDDDVSERSVLSIAYTSDKKMSESKNHSNNMCTFIKGGNNYLNILGLILFIFIINLIASHLSGVNDLPYGTVFIFLCVAIILVKYIPLMKINKRLGLGTGRSSSIIHNLILVVGVCLATLSIKGGILFFSYFALSDVFFPRSWVEYD